MTSSEPSVGRPIRNAEAVRLSEIPILTTDHWRQEILRATRYSAGKKEWRICALFALPKGGAFRLITVLANNREQSLTVFATDVRDRYPALTPDVPEAHLFEREIAEQFPIKPEGHPWLKPVRNASSTEYFKIEGDEIHEVGVGPVHAGIIEPGHFRFLCNGEDVFHLEIALGYQHRGIERALQGGPNKRTLSYMETLAGDTTIGHTLAYSLAVEGLSRLDVSPRAELIRGIALELERLANHTGDLGALAGDVGYLPTASFCGRLRGDFLNLSAQICGSRLGRGWLRPGGVLFDLPKDQTEGFLSKLKATFRDVKEAAQLLWHRPSVMARFENIGAISQQVCQELGIVGPAARACGLRNDIRHDFPSGIYRNARIHIPTRHSGDVFARAYIRWLEIQESTRFIEAALRSAVEAPISKPTTQAPLQSNSIVVSLVEGWRGEICHVALTDHLGAFARYKVIDASFHNWTGLALALRDQQISDFPLCNKSFNLSYCGYDL
ncbi:MAG: hydrogenase [Bdellovibrionales bacterium RIFOXYC1_FULL_54_43]|nr:MAG: hydrogenase [Bdellovibrionales bacterium RIFOXYC1_FULL_54_43]OFZ84334.1 MAG: hydrogenase [Bdellovibrionales bacterium RIFOXYD1_FULL_55_31]